MPEKEGPPSNHGLYVGGELFRPVEPGDSDRLEEADPQQGEAGRRVEVHQLEGVDSTLTRVESFNAVH